MKGRVHFSSQTVEWPTPKALYEELDREFGFTFDPCPLGGDVDGSARLLNNWGGRECFATRPMVLDCVPFLNALVMQTSRCSLSLLARMCDGFMRFACHMQKRFGSLKDA